MRYILTTAIITLIITQSIFAVPTAYDADIPDNMSAGEYILGYDPGYVDQTKDVSSAWVYVGNNTTDNSLLIKQGCTLAAFKNFVIGGNSGGVNNFLTVEDGELSSTNGAAAIFVGYNGGASNTFIIASDGYVTNSYLSRVGHGAGGNYNSAVISGGVWRCKYRLYCGENTGSYNQFSVTEGGYFSAAEIRLHVNAGSDYNKILVSGTNNSGTASSVILSGGLLCGYNGIGAEVKVEKGGYLECVGSTIGRYGYGHNTVKVDGIGSTWTNLTYINVGWTQKTNSIEVTNGGKVHAVQRISTGYNGGAGNSITVDGEGSLMTTDDIQLGHRYATNNIVTVQNGGKIELTDLFVISTGASTYGNKVIAKGAGSEISAVSCLVGDVGTYSTLEASDQATITLATALTIGDDATGNNNSATFSDRDTTASVGSVIYIGLAGSTNTLTIANEALVKLDGYDIRIDHNGGTNNFLQMQDGYFAWTGSKVSSLTAKESKFKLWNKTTEEFEIVTDLSAAEKEALNYSIVYYATDEEAKAVTGYDGLGGYTIITGGDNTTPPEGTLIIIQ